MGYHRAGFDVVGVDLQDMPRYPFTFHRGDALSYLKAHARSFVAVHASPPCQSSSALTKGTNRGRQYAEWIPRTRDALWRTGLPTVIENVVGAKLRPDLTLCGEMYGLDVLRHRVFELSRWSMPQPEHVDHRGRVQGWRHGVYYPGPYLAVYGRGGGKGSVAQWLSAMGIDWMQTHQEIAEAIPPAYTQHIGTALLQHIEGEMRCAT